MRILGALALSAILIGSVTAQTPVTSSKPLPATRLKPVSVAAFKNGYGYFIRKGKADVKDRQGYLTRLPDASLGAFWISTDSNAVLDELVATRYDAPPRYTVEVRNAASLADLARANVGKKVTVILPEKEITGTLLAFDPTLTVGDAKTALGAPNDLLYVLKEEAGQKEYVPFQPAEVKRLLFSELPTTVIRTLRPEKTGEPAVRVNEYGGMVPETDQRERAIRFRLKDDAPAVNLTMAYLQRGFGWTPSYRLQLSGDGNNGTIEMQAVVINDAEDLENAEVSFVVGSPNFRFAGTPSPMTLKQSLAEFFASLAQTGRGDASRFMNNGYAVQSQAPRSYSDSDGNDFAAAANASASLSGSAEDDLFFYTRPGVTLAKGERGTYSVFSAPVAVDDLYEWDVPEVSGINAYGGRENQSTPQEPVVWHSLRLKNGTAAPWTTAPALVISNGRPIAQDMLAYTPVGGSTILKLTPATNLRVSQTELEVSRENDAMRIRNSDYSIVTVDGALKIRNFSGKDVRILVTKTVNGEMLTVSDNPKQAKLAEAVRAINPTNRLSWEVVVKAGGETSLTYRYKVLVD